MENGCYVIVRTRFAGVFAGKLKHRDGKEVTLTDARRLWHWVGANCLSELAISGVSKPQECKFPAAVSLIILTGATEIIPCEDAAIASIALVPDWSFCNE